MDSAVILDNEDLRKVIALYFKVRAKNVVKIKHSYSVRGAKAREILALQKYKSSK